MSDFIEYNVCVYQNGDRFWYNKDGQLHREDGPAVEAVGGARSWWLNNKFHRVDGPAIIWSNGSKEWWVNGNLHREDGPAIEHFSGEKLPGKTYWYLNGKRYSEAEWKTEILKLKEKEKMSDDIERTVVATESPETVLNSLSETDKEILKQKVAELKASVERLASKQESEAKEVPDKKKLTEQDFVNLKFLKELNVELRSNLEVLSKVSGSFEDQKAIMTVLNELNTIYASYLVKLGS